MYVLLTFFYIVVGGITFHLFISSRYKNPIRAAFFWFYYFPYVIVMELSGKDEKIVIPTEKEDGYYYS